MLEYLWIRKGIYCKLKKYLEKLIIFFVIEFFWKIFLNLNSKVLNVVYIIYSFDFIMFLFVIVISLKYWVYENELLDWFIMIIVCVFFLKIW